MNALANTLIEPITSEEVKDRAAALVADLRGRAAETERLGRLPVLPQVNTARACITIQVVFADQPLCREISINRRGAGPTLDSLFFGSLRKIELNDDDALRHVRSSHFELDVVSFVQGHVDNKRSIPLV